MIAFVRGTVAQIGESAAVLECGGIGYNINITARDAARLHIGDEVQLHTCLNVREDAMQLFGFLSRDDLQVFRLLLTVSGVGPKGALGVLSALSANDLRFAVLSDDVKTVSSAPGIGRKTAQKLILELRDKFSLQDAFEERTAAVQAESLQCAQTDAQNEAVQALVALGYSGSDALKAVRAAASEGMDTEEILKAALRQMARF